MSQVPTRGGGNYPQNFYCDTHQGCMPSNRTTQFKLAGDCEMNCPTPAHFVGLTEGLFEPQTSNMSYRLPPKRPRVSFAQFEGMAYHTVY